ncbi:hypothetical protein BDV09DRAFT_189787 [Aspergillus tetrazonus]
MAGTKDLHELRLAFLAQLLHNSIPAELLPRFDRHAAEPDIFPLRRHARLKSEESKTSLRLSLTTKGSPRREPTTFDFSGSGWVTSNLATDHDYYKRLVDILIRFHGHLVAFPTVGGDCWAAINRIRPRAGECNLDLGRASVALYCRNANIPLALQVLVMLRIDREKCPYDHGDMEYTVPLPLARMLYLQKLFAGAPLPMLSNDPALVFTTDGRVELIRIAGAAHALAVGRSLPAKIFNRKMIENWTREFAS